MRNYTILVLLLGSFLFFGIAQAVVEISDGSVLGLYHFNGDSIDSSGHGINGTDTNITYVNGILATSSRYRSNAPSYIAFGDNFDFGMGAFTVSFWQRTTSTGLQELVGKSDANGLIEWEIRYNNAGSILECFVYDLVTRDVVSVSWATPTDGLWHHIVCRRDGANLNLFLDNNNVATSTDNLRNGDNALTAYTGQYAGGGFYFTGDLDELVIATSSLSFSKIEALYNLGNGDTVCVTVGCGQVAGSTSTCVNDSVCIMSTSTDAMVGALVGLIQVLLLVGVTGVLAYITYKL